MRRQPYEPHPELRYAPAIMSSLAAPGYPSCFPNCSASASTPPARRSWFFALPAGDTRFSPPAFPAWIDFSDPRGPYGVPDLESRGVKFGFDLHGPDFDPDTGDRQVTSAGVGAARAFFAERIPALRDAPLTETSNCHVRNTSSGDFPLDQHPEFSQNIWLAGGGSGHGFKHGPAVGEYLSARILHGRVPEPRFSLASKLETQQRTVY